MPDPLPGRTSTDFTGRTFIVPPNKHDGHTVTVEREDEISVDRWHCRCSCGKSYRLAGHIVQLMLAAAGEPPF